MLLDSNHSNTTPVVEREIPWVIHGVVVGCYQPASVLKNLPGFDELDIGPVCLRIVRRQSVLVSLL